MLSSDPVLKTIKPKLTGSLRGTITEPKSTHNVLEAIQRLFNLLTEAGFTTTTLNAQTLLEYNHDRVIAAGQLLFKAMVPPLRVRDPADNLTPPIGTTD